MTGRFSWRIGPRYFRTISFRSAAADIQRISPQDCKPSPPVPYTARLEDYEGERCGLTGGLDHHFAVWRMRGGATVLTMNACYQPGWEHWMRLPLPEKAFTYAADASWATVSVSDPWAAGTVRFKGTPFDDSVQTSGDFLGEIVARFGAGDWPERDGGFGYLIVRRAAPGSG